MESWYALKIDGTATFKKMVSKIQITYETISIKYGSPYDMGVYSQKDTEANEIIFYFTPAAKPLAEKFGAVECEAPAKDGLELSVGPESCLNFFPLEG
ncbi:MAG: hypothetical protein GY702_09245 [Desulfobulbaceae bacterium]|nr:hypothetical protein [Desulfobulbaceae bacterium]